MLVVAPLALISLEKSYSALSQQYICDQASHLLKEGRATEAAELMARMQLVHRATLNGKERELLDRSLIEGAQQWLSKNEYALAADALDKVGNKTSFVLERLAFCHSHMPVASAITAAVQAKSSKQRVGTSTHNALLKVKSEDNVASTTSSIKATSTAAPTTEPLSQTDARAQAAASNDEAPTQRSPLDKTLASLEAAGAGAPPTSNSPAPNSDSVKPATDDTQAAERTTVAPSKEAPLRFVQRDLVRYNELLALYFTSRGKAGVRGGETKEPPGLQRVDQAGQTDILNTDMQNNPENKTPSSATGKVSQPGVPLVIPDGVNYNCQGCGRCCCGWAVGLTNEDYDKVKDVDWAQKYPQLADKELFVHRESEFAAGTSLYAHFTKTQPDGACSFLIDNRCVIHSTLGEENKPRMCQLFPYSFVPTPSGIYVGVTFNSMAAVRNLGNPLTEQRPMLERMWQTMVDQERAQGKASSETAAAASAVSQTDLAGIKFDVCLVSGTALTWDEYLLLEQTLLATLKDDRFKNIFECLIAMSDYLQEAVRLKNNGKTLAEVTKLNPSPQKWLKSEPGFFEDKVFSVLCFKNFVWPKMREENSAHWNEANKNPMGDPDVISAAVKAVFLGQMKIGNESVNIDKAKKYKVSAFSPEIDLFLRRYIHLKIFSKTYCGSAMSGLSMVAGYNNIVANFLSAVLYAKANSMLKNSTELAMEDFYEGCFIGDKEGTALSQLDAGKASFYDSAFSSPRLFSRQVARISKTVAN